MKMTKDQTAIAVYNSDRKELVGIFCSGVLCAKYLFKQTSTRFKTKIWNGLRDKNKIKETVFDFNVVLRRANESQISELSDFCYIIRDGYEPPCAQFMQTFNREMYIRQIGAIG